MLFLNDTPRIRRAVRSMSLAAAGAAGAWALLVWAGPLPGQTTRRVAPKKLKPGSTCMDKGCHDNYAAGPAIHKPVAQK
ncbi:hypothetical protein LCGC14_3112150, partial [marine sediment metagenome]